MDLITLDFETYYDQQYSLSKLTTEEYIRSALFEIIGVGVKINNGETEWASGTHKQLQNYLRDPRFDWDNAALLAHNCMFDGAILAWILGIVPKVYLDTLSMARALHGVEAGGSLAALAELYQLGVKGHEVVQAKGKRRANFSVEELDKYGDYCVNDVELCYRLFNILGRRFPQKELKIIDLTHRMFTQPVIELHRQKLETHYDNTVKAKEKLLIAIAGDRTVEEAKKDLMSNPKLAAQLVSLGVEPPMKVSLTTGKPTYAFAKTDEAFKVLLEHDNPLVQTLVSTRLGVKGTIEETRTLRLLDMSHRGLLPVPLKYYGAHTGRWSGMEMLNLQNLPSRGANANHIKRCLGVPAGYTIIDADASQIEARILAWFAGQMDLVTGFANNEDVYKEMAAAIYNVPVSEVTDAQRFVGKTAILGAGFGMGWERFMDQCRVLGRVIDEDLARLTIQVYREKNGEIKGLWKQCDAVLAAMVSEDPIEFEHSGVLEVLHRKDAIRLPSGLTMQYNGLFSERTEMGVQYYYKTRKGIIKLYGGKLTENIVQAMANCLIKEQMLRAAKHYRPLLTVHDSLVFAVPDAEVHTACTYIQECLRWVPEWATGLPVNCELKIGKTYGDTKKWAA